MDPVWVCGPGARGAVDAFDAPRSVTRGRAARVALVAAWVVAAAGVAPRSADAQLNFVDEAQARGVFLVSPTGGLGSGLAMEDLDADGDLDLIITRSTGGPVAFLENDGTGNFITRNPGLSTGLLFGFNGVSVCDYDGDGLRDLYLTHTTQSNLLLHNDGGWTFSDVTVLAGVGNLGVSTGSTWGDYDGDGDNDLYVVNFDGNPNGSPFPNELYRNDGGGVFTPVAALLGLDDPKTGFQAVFFDPDLDGDLDLYLSNDRGQLDASYFHNEFWRNDGEAFTPLDNSGAEIAIDSMGVAIGDFDEDGLFDIFCTNSPPGVHTLITAVGDGTQFIDATTNTGVGSPFVGWGAEFIDFDHDTDLELFAVNSNDVNHLWECSAGFPCVDIALASNIHDSTYSVLPSRSYCFAAGDLDADGDIDLVIQSNNEPIGISMNVSNGLPAWLIVDLVGVGANPDAIGALILVDIGGETQMRQVRAGSGFRSSSPLQQHFGLGGANLVDRIRVLWPDGALTVVDNVPGNQRIVLERASLIPREDCDGDLVPDADQIAADPSLDNDFDGILDSCAPDFIRGDATVDGTLNIADPIAILDVLFGGAAHDCEQSLDANDDDSVNIADAIAVLGFLFNGAPPPPAPYPLCGPGSIGPGALPCASNGCP